MGLSTPELRRLTDLIDAALDESTGYIAIEWALRKRGYYVTPSYRRTPAEWFRYINELFPSGYVSVIHETKPNSPELLRLTNYSAKDDRALIHLEWSPGSGWDLDVTDAHCVDDELRGVTTANGSGYDLTLRRGVKW
jgi:hypothetical protein